MKYKNRLIVPTLVSTGLLASTIVVNAEEVEQYSEQNIAEYSNEDQTSETDLDFIDSDEESPEDSDEEPDDDSEEEASGEVEDADTTDEETEEEEASEEADETETAEEEAETPVEEETDTEETAEEAQDEESDTEEETSEEVVEEETADEEDETPVEEGTDTEETAEEAQDEESDTEELTSEEVDEEDAETPEEDDTEESGESNESTDSEEEQEVPAEEAASEDESEEEITDESDEEEAAASEKEEETAEPETEDIESQNEEVETEEDTYKYDSESLEQELENLSEEDRAAFLEENADDIEADMEMLDELTEAVSEENGVELAANEVYSADASTFSTMSVSQAITDINDYIAANDFDVAEIQYDLIEGLPHYAFESDYGHDPENGKVGQPSGVVLHDVGNENSTIHGEINYMSENWENAFVHAFVDADNIIQVANTDYLAYGAGPVSNQTHLHVELVRHDNQHDFAKSINNYADYIANLLYKYKLPAERVDQSGDGTLWSHVEVSHIMGGTASPDPYEYFASHGYAYEDVISLIDSRYNDLYNKVTDPNIYMPTFEGDTENLAGEITDQNRGLYESITDVKTYDASNFLGQDLHVVRSEIYNYEEYYLLADADGSEIGWMYAGDVMTSALDVEPEEETDTPEPEAPETPEEPSEPEAPEEGENPELDDEPTETPEDTDSNPEPDNEPTETPEPEAPEEDDDEGSDDTGSGNSDQTPDEDDTGDEDADEASDDISGNDNTDDNQDSDNASDAPSEGNDSDEEDSDNDSSATPEQDDTESDQNTGSEADDDNTDDNQSSEENSDDSVEQDDTSNEGTGNAGSDNSSDDNTTDADSNETEGSSEDDPDEPTDENIESDDEEVREESTDSDDAGEDDAPGGATAETEDGDVYSSLEDPETGVRVISESDELDGKSLVVTVLGSSDAIDADHDLYDIHVLDENGSLYNLNNPVTVYLPAGGYVSNVYYLGDIGETLEAVNFRTEDGYAVFEASSFSQYAVVYGAEDADNTTVAPVSKDEDHSAGERSKDRANEHPAVYTEDADDSEDAAAAANDSGGGSAEGTESEVLPNTGVAEQSTTIFATILAALGLGFLVRRKKSTEK